MTNLVDRFIKYVKFETTSDEILKQYLVQKNQLEFAKKI